MRHSARASSYEGCDIVVPAGDADTTVLNSAFR
jgi:hypothetical protein